MEILIVAQTIFYLTVSAAIIVVGVLFAIVTYHLIRIAKELEEISRGWRDASDEARARINDIIDRLSEVPVLSYFLRRRNTDAESKGEAREESHWESSQTSKGRKRSSTKNYGKK